MFAYVPPLNEQHRIVAKLDKVAGLVGERRKAIETAEGAVAIAQPKDDGRVGSHRFLTCVADESMATVDFLRFYFLTPEGLQKLGDASPGGAGRNRTLGLKKLDAIAVPVPPLERQRWFDRLQRRVQQVEALRESAGEDVEGLLPALLHGVFNGEKAD